MRAIEAFDLELLDSFMVLLPLIMVVLALALGAIAVRIVCRPGRDTAPADDPYFFPIGEVPILPHHSILPHELSALAPRGNESGGRSTTSPRSSAVALTSSGGARHG